MTTTFLSRLIAALRRILLGRRAPDPQNVLPQQSGAHKPGAEHPDSIYPMW